MKKMKLISIILAALMVFSSVNVLAENTFDGDTAASVNGATKITVTSSVPGFSGKDINDTVYSITGAVADAGSGNVGFNVAANTTGGTETVTVEMQFLLPTVSDGLRISIHHYYDSAHTVNSTLPFNISASGVTSSSNRVSSITTHIQPNIEANKWYTLSFDVSGNGGKTIPVYINGDKVATINGNNSYPMYGIRSRLLVGPNTATGTVYVDDVHTYKASEHTFSVDELTPSSVESVANGKVVNSNTIGVLDGTTVSELKSAITTDGSDDVVKIYNSELTAELDANANAIGGVVVVAAKKETTTEQAYRYYTVNELDLDEEHGRGKNASDLVIHNTNNVANSTVTSVEGNFGKKASDDVYKVDHNKDYSINLTPTFYHDKTQAAMWSEDYGNLEFSFAIPEGGGIRIHAQYFDSAQSTGHTYQFLNFEEGEFNTNTGSTVGKREDVNIEANKWYTVGITLNTDGAEDGTFDIYLNGEYITSVGAARARGFRQPSLSPYANTTAYFDNISMSRTSTYEASKDTPALVKADGAVAADGKVSYVTLPSSFTSDDANTSVRLYDTNWNEVNAVVEAKYVVSAGKDATLTDRVLAYYEIDDEASDYVLGVTNDGTNLKAIGYGKDNNATVYLAKYVADGTELVEIIPVELENNTAVITAAKESGYQYRAYIWDANLKPYGKVTSFDLRK